MKIKCGYIDDISVSCDKNIILNLRDVSFYSLYMNNDIKLILDEIPLEELQEYINKRVEDDTS